MAYIPSAVSTSPYYRPTPAMPDFDRRLAELTSKQDELAAQQFNNQWGSQQYDQSSWRPVTAIPKPSEVGVLTPELIRSYFTPPQDVRAAAQEQAVNSAGSYTKNYTGGYGPSAYGFRGVTGGSAQRGKAKFGFQPEMWKALSAANAGMAAAGLGTFGITDGFRSYSSQVSLKKKKPNLAATPGRSVHGLGLAADLKLTARQQKWLEANGAKYGLLRLPSEAWHWQLNPNRWHG